jgi:hypothetical protein
MNEQLKENIYKFASELTSIYLQRDIDFAEKNQRADKLYAELEDWICVHVGAIY